MKAAVLYRLGGTPRYEDFPEPVPGPDEVMVTMTAAPINNIDRMMAAGTHYHHDAGYRLPAVVGLSGVGVLDDGQRVAFDEVKAPYGTFAEKAAVNKAHIFPLPDGIDDEMAAVLPNPALSSLMALRSHDFQPGQNVLHPRCNRSRRHAGRANSEASWRGTSGGGR